MKKLVMILMLFLCIGSLFATSSVASKKNEISVKFGYMPYFETLISGLMSINHKETTGSMFLPVVSCEYLRYVSPNHGLGATITTGSPVLSKGPTNVMFPVISLQGTYRGIYLNKENFKLYGEINAGGEVIFNPLGDSLPFFSAYVAPLGIWFGKDSFFGSLEIGMGTQGSLAVLGCGLRF